MDLKFSPSQKRAAKLIESTDRVFLTGGAGTGKSFLVKAFLKDKSPKTFPVLASTGAAAVLIGGRTFHSFFSLGILEGGFEASVERALKDQKLHSRLSEIEGFVLDEVSMIPAMAFRAAESICRLCLDPSTAWGGLKVLAVGDFFQLPPVNVHSRYKDWCFLDDSWIASQFTPAVLEQNMRTQDSSFLKILEDVRMGILSPDLKAYLERRSLEVPDKKDIVRLFPRRDKVEKYNLDELEKIDEVTQSFHTEYSGNSKLIEQLKRLAPVPEKLSFKVGAFVMLRQNDPVGRFVNGSVGHIREIYEEEIEVELDNGRQIRIEKTNFSLLDADGYVVAVARNFPMSLAYATTIHKSQGSSLDSMAVDISGLWEPGQAYVALSRAKKPEDVYIMNWDKTSFKVSTEVQKYYAGLMNSKVTNDTKLNSC